jgi:hypothetical protein
MPTRESSSELSSLASSVLQLRTKAGTTPVGLGGDANTGYVPASEYNALLEKAKRLAGSVMSQDETPLAKIGRFIGLGRGRTERFARR